MAVVQLGLLLWMECMVLHHVYSANGNESDTPVTSAERRLLNVLLNRYKSLGDIPRPVQNASDLVTVEFGIRLVHLDLQEKEQVMKTSVWVRMAWKDKYLMWDPKEYDGVKSVVMPVNNIWKPDIVLVNTAETTVKEQSADILVNSKGSIFWAPERSYSSACLIDVTEYPFDKHTCDMWFQSIANPSGNLNITPYHKSPLDLDTYLTSYKHAQEWDIVSNTSSWHKRPRDVGMILMWSRRASLRFSLTVQRRAGFKGMLLIVPCALLSFLIPIVFCFPPERPDRHSLAMSLFASLTILLFMVNEVAPPSAAFVPRLALYYSFNLLVLLFATCCSAVIVNLSRRGDTKERIPRLVKVVFIDVLGKFFCFKNKLEHLNETRRASGLAEGPERQNIVDGQDMEKGTSDDDTCQPNTKFIQNGSECAGNPVFVDINRRLGSIEQHILTQKGPKKNGQAKDNAKIVRKLEWQTLSMVLDRMFFVLFLIIDIVSLGVFHPRLP